MKDSGRTTGTGLQIADLASFPSGVWVLFDRSDNCSGSAGFSGTSGASESYAFRGASDWREPSAPAPSSAVASAGSWGGSWASSLAGMPVACLLTHAAGYWPLVGAPESVRALAEDAVTHRQLSRLLEGESRRRNWPARGYLVEARPPAGVAAVCAGPSLWFVPFRWAAEGGGCVPPAPPPEVVAAALDAVAAGYELTGRPAFLPDRAASLEREISPGTQGWEDEYRTTLDVACTAAKAMRRAGFSRGLTRAVARSGYILRNGFPVMADALLAAGDRLRILAPSGPPSPVRPETGRLDIVYEDGDLLVVNKPAGLLVHAARQAREATLAGLVVNHLAGHGRPSPPRAVGRLDRGTSGLVVFARTRFAQEALVRQRRDGRAAKEYLALTVRGSAGHPPGQGFVETRPIEPPPFDRGRYREPRTARTVLRTLRWFASGALVAVSPETGRTHQIRQHLAAAGMPLYGDRTYGGPLGPIGRPALHAWRLRFSHPVTGEHLTLRAPLPDDMRRLLRRFLPQGLSTDCGSGREVSFFT